LSFILPLYMHTVRFRMSVPIISIHRIDLLL
jgi:hypothetical protein